jgi:hypothetical protein
LRFYGPSLSNTGAIAFDSILLSASPALSLSGNGTWTGNSCSLGGQGVNLANDVTLDCENLWIGGLGVVDLGGHVLTFAGTNLTIYGTIASNGLVRIEGGSTTLSLGYAFESALEIASGSTTLSCGEGRATCGER